MSPTWKQRAARRLQALTGKKYTECFRLVNDRVASMSVAAPEMSGNDLRIALNEQLDQFMIGDEKEW